MPWIQKTITLKSRPRGFHLVTDELLAALPELSAIHAGLLHLFIQHTSASLTINENADPDVRKDMEEHLRRLMPDNAPHYLHDAEGPDDMPAHVKTMLTATSLQIPVLNGAMALGTWQGIYVAEHRARPHRREIVLQFQGSAQA